MPKIVIFDPLGPTIVKSSIFTNCLKSSLKCHIRDPVCYAKSGVYNINSKNIIHVGRV